MNLPHTKKSVIESIEAMRLTLEGCINEGMLDPDAHFYNEVNDFLAEARLSNSFEELQEVITQAHLLEMDIDAWLARKGRTTLSLSWPKIPKPSK